MKADRKRLALLFYEAGMISRETFAKSGAENEEKSRGLMDVLKQDVSVDSMRELLTLEVDLTFKDGTPLRVPSRGSKTDQTIDLHDALSQSVYINDDEIRALLSAWKPPLQPLLEALHAAGAMTTEPAAALEEVGKGANAYGKLLDGNIINTAYLHRAVTVSKSPLKQRNRLLLALELLRYNEVIEQSDCDDIIKDYDAKGTKGLPQLRDEIIDFINSQPEMPEIGMLEVTPPDKLRARLPYSFLRQNQILPAKQNKNVLQIVVSDPFYPALPDTLSLLTGQSVLPLYAETHSLLARLREVYGINEESAESASATPVDSAPLAKAPPPPKSPPKEPRMLADRGSAVEIVSTLIEGGVTHAATDVHLEPTEQGGLRIRYRIDGRLRRITDVEASHVSSVISRIKVLSNLDVAERRRSQDGHFSLQIGGGSFDFRVSTLPTNLGEKIVIRILDESRILESLEDLGMEPDQVKMMRGWIARPHGLVLVTGPTGSGKTSTLYASLNNINSEEKNIVTIEDPVEYQIDGINQVEVDPAFGLSFADGLRSILRQDPDVIMVGEVRDPDTAYIAMRAALTGHLVLSTLHTNTAIGAISTLRQMSIEPYMLSSALSGVVSQRLLRRLDPEFKKGFVPKKALLEALGMPDSKSRKRMYRPEGAEDRIGQGYKGRTGVYELLPMSEEIGEAVLEEGGESRIRELARENNCPTLLENAIKKLYAGETSPEEVLESILID